MNAPGSALPTWAARLNQGLDANDRDARELVSGLSVDDLNRQSGPGAWSIGQCIEHLCLGTETYVPPLHAALEGRPVAPVQEITPGWFGRWFIRNYIEPSPQTKRATAPSKIVPGRRVELSILERFLAGNQRIREVIHRAAAHDVNRIRFKNPYIPGLRFTIGTGLQILYQHERRHLLQAQRVREAMRS
jgi:hypothetical protein